MSELSLLSVSDLACVRGGRLVFRALSFKVEAGAALAIEGQNGAGKTSLLRMLAGFLPPAKGSVRMSFGAEEIDDGEERGRRVAFLGHQEGVKPQLTVSEQLDFYARLYQVNSDIAPALESVGLARLKDMPCHYLSAGQKKRLSLARLSLVARPLWLLDEPLASLDVQGKEIAANLVKTHCAAGGIAVAATHEPLGFDAQRLSLVPA